MKPIARRISLLILTLIGPGGCAAYPVPTTVDVPGMPNPEIALRESMGRVDKEMRELGALRPARVGPPVFRAELDRVVAFEWHGPLDGAVQRLAGTIGYSTSSNASFGMNSVDVTINMGPARVYEVFEALGNAAGSQATVRVDPQHQRVEVIHHV